MLEIYFLGLADFEMKMIEGIGYVKTRNPRPSKRTRFYSIRRRKEMLGNCILGSRFKRIETLALAYGLPTRAWEMMGTNTPEHLLRL